MGSKSGSKTKLALTALAALTFLGACASESNLTGSGSSSSLSQTFETSTSFLRDSDNIVEPPDSLTPEPPDSLTPEPPDSLTPEPPDSLTPEPPDSLTPEPPDSLTPEPPDSLTPEPQIRLITRTEDFPMVTALHPDFSDVFVALRQGRVARLNLETASMQIIMDFSREVTTLSELGFLGLAFSPDGKWLYTMHSDRATSASILRATPFNADGTLEQTQTRDLLEIPQPFGNHNGGDIRFSPKDGYLYIALGDGGSAFDPLENGQNTATLAGSILRIDPKPEESRYEIPPDNPFANSNNNQRPEIWVYGVRNPWRMSFHPETGDLWFGDVGQDRFEEINKVTPEDKGSNLGWNIYEGTQSVRSRIDRPIEHFEPIFEYDHSKGRCSVTGGHIYEGQSLPQLKDTYVYSDFCDPQIRAFSQSENPQITNDLPLAQPPDSNVIAFGKTPDGETLVMSSSAIYLLTAGS